MRFEIVTLFPELFDVLQHGLLGRARDAGRIDVLPRVDLLQGRVDASRATAIGPSMTLPTGEGAGWC